MMNCQNVKLQDQIIINNLLAVHYFPCSENIFFPGGSHRFWEFLYVDQGEATVTAGNQMHLLKSGQVIFHKPMEFHHLWPGSAEPSHIVRVAFECTSPSMHFFDNRILQLDEEDRSLLARMVQEARALYVSPLEDPGLTQSEFRQNAPFAALQVLHLTLELLLLLLIRKNGILQNASSDLGIDMPDGGCKRDSGSEDILTAVLRYLETHVAERLTLDEVCRSNHIGRSCLQKMFRERVGGGVMEYFGRLKIEAAKQAIQEHSGSFTEIADSLGYASIHYFSRHFKKITGITPSEYAASVRVRAEGLHTSAGPLDRCASFYPKQ